MMSTAEQIKNVAGHQDKFTVVLGLGLKRDQHNETKKHIISSKRPLLITDEKKLFL